MTTSEPAWTLAYAAVFLGGGLGALARLALSRALPPFDAANGFPWATFTVNLVGSALLGGLLHLRASQPAAWHFLAVGFCGGLTTFSTFSGETWRLYQSERLFACGAYVLGSTILGFGLCGLIYRLGIKN